VLTDVHQVVLQGYLRVGSHVSSSTIAIMKNRTKELNLGQIKYIVNCTEQTTEGIQATYMELLVRRAMKRVPGPISCLRLPGTLQHCEDPRCVTCLIPLPFPSTPLSMLCARIWAHENSGRDGGFIVII
jgi:hypothetical protein